LKYRKTQRTSEGIGRGDHKNRHNYKLFTRSIQSVNDRARLSIQDTNSDYLYREKQNKNGVGKLVNYILKMIALDVKKQG